MEKLTCTFLFMLYAGRKTEAWTSSTLVQLQLKVASKTYMTETY